MTWLGLVVRSIGRRPGRSVFTALGVALAVGSFMALTGLSGGMEEQSETSLEARGVDLVVTQRGMVEIFGGALPQALGSAIAGVPGVAGVSGELGTLLQVSDDTQAVVVGWQEDAFGFRDMHLLRGRLAKAGENGVVLGDTLAEALRADIGSEVTLNFMSFRVTGIADFSTGFLRSLAVMPLTDLEDLLSRPGQVTVFQVRLDHPGDAVEREAVRERIAALRPDIAVTPTSEALRNSKVVALLGAMSLAIAIVALVAGGLSVLNTMAMAVEERTRDIGILSSIGWSRQTILALILTEGVLLAIAGGVIGVGLGWVGYDFLVDLLSPGSGLTFPAMLVQAGKAMIIASGGGRGRGAGSGMAGRWPDGGRRSEAAMNKGRQCHQDAVVRDEFWGLAKCSQGGLWGRMTPMAGTVCEVRSQ